MSKTALDGGAKAAPPLVLGRAAIAALMRPADYLSAVESGFRASRQGQVFAPHPMHIPAADGGFHGKGASMKSGDRVYVALKLNGNFPGNPARNGLPTIQGVILLCDGVNGSVLAILDSIEVTLQRTAAASALAARHLAREDASTIAILGCGAQAIPHVEAMAGVRRIKQGRTWDIEPSAAARMAEMASQRAGVPFTAARSLQEATRGADIIVTSTTAKSAFLDVEHVDAGSFIAAVGADNPEKSEITPRLMARAAIVADVLDQCLVMGDLHHAVKSGLVSQTDVRGDLAGVVCGDVRGRQSNDEIVVFDSTGTAIEDVASAAIVYERARAAGAGAAIELA